MLIDAIPFDELLKTSFKKRPGLQAFVRFLERRLGGKFIFERQRLPYGRTDLVDLFEQAEALRAANIIHSYRPVNDYPDEPRFYQWVADLIHKKTSSGGMSQGSDRSALTAALAEAVERHVWFTAECTDVIHATTCDIRRQGDAIVPGQFAGFTHEQRERDPLLTLRPDVEYQWTRGQSLINGNPVWIPAQVANGKYGIANFKNRHEPIILEPITTGMAAGPSQTFVRLGGALEIIERDAFMITWLNQLSPPRIDLMELGKQSPSLTTLIERCSRYRLSIEAMLLPSDAPAHAVCVVVRDECANLPPWSMGLSAHRSLSHAVEHAALEALRIRRITRWHMEHAPLDDGKKARDVVHVERTHYWAIGDRYKKLAFLTQGPLVKTPAADIASSPEEHLSRLTGWCKKNAYECAAISYTDSPQNVSPWHVEMVVMPELIPIHQNEKNQYAGGPRRESVARMFGYVPRPEPYLDEPHPFC